jgi:hypothetical protein
MKQPEDMKISIAWREGNKNLAYKEFMQRLVNGEDLAGDHVLRLGIWLVTEVLRRNETPSFRRGFFRDRLMVARALGAKYSALLKCWPGAPAQKQYVLDQQQHALDLLKLLKEYAPEDSPPDFDTSGDI